MDMNNENICTVEVPNAAAYLPQTARRPSLRGGLRILCTSGVACACVDARCSTSVSSHRMHGRDLHRAK